MDDIAHALQRLRAAQPIALPTETVYGLAADACSDVAVRAIYEMKGRPSSNPLIIHVSGVEMAARYVRVSELAERLAEQFWPGPLTLVLDKVANCAISALASGGGDTLAVRAPNHPTAQALIGAFDGGLAAPSANRSGRISPTLPAHVRAEFPDLDLLILDGGASVIGIESTVVDARGDAPVILRPGSVTMEMLEKCCDIRLWPAGQSLVPEGLRLIAESSRTQQELNAHISPGLLSSHYAPSIPVRLNAVDVQGSEALLAFGSNVPTGAKTTLNLSAQGNLDEAAKHLYNYMRQLDTPAHSAIAVMPIPNKGIGLALNDRLTRAAKKEGGAA